MEQITLNFETPLKGITQIIVRDARHATVVFEDVHVNRTEQSGNFHVVLADGAWQLWTGKNDDSLANTPFERRRWSYFRPRWDGRQFVETSLPTRFKVLNVLLLAATEALQNHPELLTDAERAKIRKEIDETEKELESARQQVSTLLDSHLQLLTLLANLPQ